MERFSGTVRPYTEADVKKLRGWTKVEHSLARLGAERLWGLLNSCTEERPCVAALGASTGNVAVQQVKAGLRAIYVSGWQAAADANGSPNTYPDQSLYPCDSVPKLVRRINGALLRAEQIDAMESEEPSRHWLAPVVADAEAGFGGPLNAFELMKGMIEAGAAGVHFEDQLASEKKCGHMGGKVLVPTSQFVKTLVAARLAADVCDVPTVIVARTDALSAQLLTSDIDPRDHEFISDRGDSRSRTPEGFYRLKGSGIDRSVSRALSYAPYADVLWFETSEPDVEQALEFAERVHAVFPGKLLAYNCSPSFNWKKKLDAVQIGKFQDTLGEAGYRFQFVTLAGFHAMSLSMFKLARAYDLCGMTAYADLQERELEEHSRGDGYTAVKHQREVGMEYFSEVSRIVSSGQSTTLPTDGSTEREQFYDVDPDRKDP